MSVAAAGLARETLCGVRPGMTMDDVVALIGMPVEISTTYEDAPGVWLQSAQWGTPQLTIQLAAPAEDGPFTVRGIMSTDPGSGTSRGITCGATIDDVRAAYPELAFEVFELEEGVLTTLRAAPFYIRFVNDRRAGTIVLGVPPDYADLFPMPE